MNLPRYDISVNETFHEFAFDSEGPQGKIKKRIVFTPVNGIGRTYFNLAFGDVNESTGELDDFAVSNNQYREKVLATVAACVLIFIGQFPNVDAYATGRTPARTKLYQMSISVNRKIIQPFLEIFGRLNGRWERFSKNNQYEAFLALRKRYHIIP